MLLPNVVLSPGLVLLAPRPPFEGPLPRQCTVGLQPGGGAPGAGQQGQGLGGHGLSPLQQGDLDGEGLQVRRVLQE